VSADNGYYSVTNLGYLKDRGFDGYIPNQHITQIMKGKKTIKKNPFGKENLEYNSENDEFICPNNKRITFRYEYFDKCKRGNIRIYMVDKHYCRKCEYYKQCVKNKKGIKITDVLRFETNI